MVFHVEVETDRFRCPPVFGLVQQGSGFGIGRVHAPCLILAKVCPLRFARLTAEGLPLALEASGATRKKASYFPKKLKLVVGRAALVAS